MTTPQLTDDYIHVGHRRRLVQLLREKGIRDEAVLAAIAKVPRHWFVGRSYQHLAYEDRALPIGQAQTISQPYTVAAQTEWLRANPRDKVLEIGTGSGYQAAVLATLGLRVYTLERQESLYIKTNTLLSRQRFGMVRCFLKDGFKGLPAYAPFDRILLTAGAADVPGTLLEQLAIGGEMVVPIGTEAQVMHRIIRNGEDDFTAEKLGNFKFVPFKEGLVRRKRPETNQPLGKPSFGTK